MSRSAKPPKTALAIERKSRSIKGSPAHDLEQRLAEALKREAQALKQLQTRNEEVLDAHAKRHCQRKIA